MRIKKEEEERSPILRPAYAPVSAHLSKYLCYSPPRPHSDSGKATAVLPSPSVLFIPLLSAWNALFSIFIHPVLSLSSKLGWGVGGGGAQAGGGQ